MIAWLAWIVLSIPMLVIARRDLGNPRGHGFYRLLAYEAMLGLLIVSLPGWLAGSALFPPIASWVLIAASFGLAIHSLYLLRTAGRPDGPVENTTRLVRAGAFRWIRHPLYAAIIVFSWGVFLRQAGAAGALLALAVTALLAVAARIEERETLARFGEPYARYIQETRMFIPFLF